VAWDWFQQQYERRQDPCHYDVVRSDDAHHADGAEERRQNLQLQLLRGRSEASVTAFGDAKGTTVSTYDVNVLRSFAKFNQDYASVWQTHGNKTLRT